MSEGPRRAARSWALSPLVPSPRGRAPRRVASAWLRWGLMLSVFASPAGLPTAQAAAEDLRLALSVADELEDEHRWLEARRQLHAVAEASLAADGAADEARRELAADLLLRACGLWLVEGEPEQARSCWLALAQRRGLPRAAAAMARYKAGSMAARLGWSEAALADATEVVERFAGEPAAGRALLLAMGSIPEPARRIGWLQQRLAALDGSVAAAGPEGAAARGHPELATQLGRQLLDAGRAGEAVTVLRRAVQAAAKGPWRDDAQIWLARAWAATGGYAEAEHLFEALIDAHRPAWFFGSYTGAFFDDALYESGRLHALRGATAAARDRYQALLQRAPFSRLRDDAAYHLAALAEPAQRQAALRRFLRDYPDSRWTAAARTELGRAPGGQP